MSRTERELYSLIGLVTTAAIMLFGIVTWVNAVQSDRIEDLQSVNESQQRQIDQQWQQIQQLNHEVYPWLPDVRCGNCAPAPTS